MAAILTPEQRQQISQQLRGRILNVIPAASYQMDRLLSLADITLSDTTQTAAMECGPQPVLHLNGEFVQKYCQRDEHLMMLVMHELYHLILGHTRLYLRLTQAHNIVFDAVINALLCQQFRDPVYPEFFQKLSRADRFPGSLLRPPKGWPSQTIYRRGISEPEKKVMDLLYGQHSETVTYHEIMKLLENQLSPDSKRDCVLLGDHSGQNGEGLGDQTAEEDDLVNGILREVTSGWPDQANLGTGRGDGSRVFDWLAPKARSPRAEFLAALMKLLRKAAVLPADPHTPYAWRLKPAAQSSQTVIPDLRDRLAEGRRDLYGQAPLFYNIEVPIQRKRWSPRDTTHVYIDVSGSMNDCLPWLVGALEPLIRKGIIRLFAFSTVVSPMDRGQGFQSRIHNTFGTNINCVLEHLVGYRIACTPAKVLVLTDGFFGNPKLEFLIEIKSRRTKILVGLIGSKIYHNLTDSFDLVYQLPPLK